MDAARGSRMSFPWVLYRNYYFFEQTEHTPTRHKYGVLPRQSHYEPGQSSDKNPVFAPNTAACTHGESANVLTIGNEIWTHNLPLRKKKWKCGMGDAPQNRTHANAKRTRLLELRLDLGVSPLETTQISFNFESSIPIFCQVV